MNKNCANYGSSWCSNFDCNECPVKDLADKSTMITGLGTQVNKSITSITNKEPTHEQIKIIKSIQQQVAKEIFAVYDEYIQLLVDELNELVGRAYAEGWRSTKFENGKECRDKIQSLKSSCLSVDKITGG